MLRRSPMPRGTSTLKRTPFQRKPPKKKKTKRAKLASRKSLIRKIDHLVFLFVCARDPACVECGTTDKPTTGHVLSRRSFSTRWDERNVWRQCWGCNYKAAMTAAASYHLWFVKKFGVESFEQLYRDWTGGRKYSRLQLVALVAEWETKVNSMLQCKAGQPSLERQADPAETTNGDALAAWQNPA